MGWSGYVRLLEFVKIGEQINLESELATQFIPRAAVRNNIQRYRTALDRER